MIMHEKGHKRGFKNRTFTIKSYRKITEEDRKDAIKNSEYIDEHFEGLIEVSEFTSTVGYDFNLEVTQSILNSKDPIAAYKSFVLSSTRPFLYVFFPYMSDKVPVKNRKDLANLKPGVFVAEILDYGYVEANNFDLWVLEQEFFGFEIKFRQDSELITELKEIMEEERMEAGGYEVQELNRNHPLFSIIDVD